MSFRSKKQTEVSEPNEALRASSGFKLQAVFGLQPSIKIILLGYVLVIIGAFIYFAVLQGFGYRGLEFTISGKDRVLAPLDILILLSTIASLILLAISIVAFERKKDNRFFVLAFAFFFFTLRQVLFLLDNFFPEENIYIFHAVHALDILILLSFMFLMYRR